MSRREDIDNAIWDDHDFEALSPYATLLYLWSFTNPRCGMAGLYQVSYRGMGESKVPREHLPATLAELAEARFAFYEDSVLWVRTRVKHLRSRSPQMAISVVNDLLKLNQTHPLRARFLEEYGTTRWLQQALNRTSRDGIGNLSENTVDKPDSDTLSGPYLEGPGQGCKEGQGQGSKPPRKTVAQDELPSSLPDVLHPVAIAVLSVLEAVQTERGGHIPTLRGVGLALAAFPDRDHIGVVRQLEHWALAGTGQRKPVKDWAATYRTFLDGTPAGAPVRTRPAAAGRESASDLLRAINGDAA